MGKTLLYVLVLGIFAFGVWFFLFNEKSLFSEDEAGFQIRDTAAVHKIFLANKKGDTIALRRTNEGWTVNGTHRASQRMTENLLVALRFQEPAYPVPEVAHNNVVKMLAGSAIKAEVFDKDDELIRTFYIGGQVNNNKGTYMLMEGADRPYVVKMPGYGGYLTPRYSVQLKEWRDRTAFSLKPEELERVEISYLSEEEYLNSFTMISKDNSTFNIETHPELNLNGELNERRVKTFSEFFERVGFEGFLAGTTGLDSIIANADKYCSIDITTTNNRHEHVDIYWMPVNKRSKNLSTPDDIVPDDYDPDRFYGVLHNFKDTVILQRYTFDRFFRKGYEFYEKDAE